VDVVLQHIKSRSWTRSLNAPGDRRNGVTALMLAAEYGKDAVARALVDDGQAPLELRNNRGATALALAAWHGHDDVVQALIDRRADVCCADNFGAFALHYAAGQGHVEIVNLLLTEASKIDTEPRGVDPEVQRRQVELEQADRILAYITKGYMKEHSFEDLSSLFASNTRGNLTDKPFVSREELRDHLAGTAKYYETCCHDVDDFCWSVGTAHCTAHWVTRDSQSQVAISCHPNPNPTQPLLPSRKQFAGALSRSAQISLTDICFILCCCRS